MQPEAENQTQAREMSSDEVVKDEHAIDVNMKVAELTVGQLFNLLNAVVERAGQTQLIATQHAIQEHQRAQLKKGIIRPLNQ